jgi:sugar lactone lactonase YvrE
MNNQRESENSRNGKPVQLLNLVFSMSVVFLSVVFLPANARAEALPVGEGVVVRAAMGIPPEGVAVDKTGQIFVSDFGGRILKLTQGDQFQVCQTPPPALGLTVDASGNAYVAATGGVYRIDRDGSGCSAISGTEGITYPNALAFDKVGNLYVTDSVEGKIYRISTWGNVVELWADDPLFKPWPLPDPTLIVGANGIQYWRGSLIVANTSQFKIIRIPIRDDGSAGTAEVLFDALTPTGPLFVPDGITLDVYGNIYIADPAFSQLVRVAADGQAVEILANGFAGAPLDNPTSLAFGTGKGDRKNVYMVNAAIFGPPDEPGPSLVKFGTGNPGNPLP